MPRKGEQSIPITDVRKQMFLDWLCTPVKQREPKTMNALADELGVQRRTLTNWKDDTVFLEAWEKRYRKTVGSFEKSLEVMNTMHATATDREDPKHVQAGKNYMEIIGAIAPPKLEVSVKGDASQLSDDELFAMLAQRAEDEIERRKADAVIEEIEEEDASS